MNIIFNGMKYGIWDVEHLPRLAQKLGVTVEEIVAASEVATEIEKQTAAISKGVKSRLGSPSAIAAVTANAATLSLVLGLSMLKALGGSEELEAVQSDLNLMFPDAGGEAVTELMEMLGGFMSGEVQTPISVKGLAASISEIEHFSTEANLIMTGGAKTNERNNRQHIDPVTG